MKIEKEFNKIINNKPELFPLGYQFLKRKKHRIVEARISKSQSHNSTLFIVGNFYKPTSLIFSNEPEKTKI